MKPNSRLAPLIAALVAAAGLAGCATHTAQTRSEARAGNASGEPRGPVQTTADAAITAKVKTSLAADDLVKARNIDVDTVRGVVQLNGTVDSVAEKQRALSVARNVQGVLEVKDNLRVGG